MSKDTPDNNHQDEIYKTVRQILVSTGTIILWLFISLIIANLISCRTARTTTTTTDTLIVQSHDTIIHDRLVPVSTPPDSSAFHALIECDSNNRAALRMVEILNGRNNRLTYTIDSLGNLNIRSIVPPDTIYIPVHDTIIINDNNTRITTDTQTTITKEPTFWDKFKTILTTMIITILAILSIYTLYRIYKRFHP